MIKLIFDNLRSLHFSTELLEVLGWDEAETEKIIKDLSEYFENTDANRSVSLVKLDLHSLFQEDVCKVIFKYIDYVSSRIIEEGGSIDYEA